MDIVPQFALLSAQRPVLAARLMEAISLVSRLTAETGEAEAPTLVAAEEQIGEALDQVYGLAMGSILEAYGPEEAEVEVGGLRYRQMKHKSRGVYFSLRGPVVVMRHLYRQVGVHDGPTIVPLELRAGIVGGRWLPKAAVAAAHLLQDEPSRDAAATCRALGVMPYSRSSLSRAGEEIGNRWEEIRMEAESEVAAAFEIPVEAVALSIGVDRVSLPMSEPVVDTEGEPVLDEEGRGHAPVVYRMAYCGIATLHDKEGEPLASFRYGRMPEEGHGPVEESLWGDVEQLKAVRPDLRLLGIADGAPEMQQILERVLQPFETDVHIAIDFWHVAEKLAAAISATGRLPANLLPGFKRILLEDDLGAEQVSKVPHAWASAMPEGECPQALRDAITYLDRNAHRMRYADLRRHGLPIGSGHVEATCKTLVSTRMKRSGARWRNDGGQVVLSLRSLARSSRWDPAMNIVTRSFRQTGAVAA